MLLVKQQKIIENFLEADIKAVKSQCGLRRADRFTALATTAIKLTFPEQFPSFLQPDTGLIVVSSFGPHRTVFAMLDDILDYPEDQILPTKFSHSVQNAVVSYLGTILGLKGPAFAISNFESPLVEALKLADTLLTAEVSGEAELLGFGSGKPVTDENYTKGQFTSYQGKALAVLRAGCEAGEARLTVSADGLGKAEICLQVK